MRKPVVLFLACLLIFASLPALAQAQPEVYTLKIAHNMDFVTIPDSVVAAAERLCKRYADEGRNVTINFEKDYQRIDWTEYHNNILFADKSGDGPDLFHMTDDIYGALEAGLLMDLSELATDRFADGIFAPYTIDGKVYGMPFDMPLRVMYYNKKGLEAVGWTAEAIEALPQKIAAGEFTFEEFMALAEEVQQKGGAKFAMAHRPGAGHDFFEIMRVLGGEYYDENGKLVFDEQGILRFFQFIYDNANTRKITPPDLNQMGWGTINTMVGNGEAFAYYGPLYSSTYVANAVNKTPAQLVEDVSFALFPASQYNETPFCVAAPQGMGVNAKTQYPELCKDLLKELANGSADLLANHASTIFTLSSVKEANTMEVITTNPVLKAVTYMADYAVTPPSIRGIATYSSEMHKQIVLLELGQTTAEQAVEDFKTQIELNLDGDTVTFR